MGKLVEGDFNNRVPISRESASYDPKDFPSPPITVKELCDSPAEKEILRRLRVMMCHLTFHPNMALSAFLEYESAKKHLPANVFQYFLTSRVDFLIMSGDRAIGGVEVDSRWHNNSASRHRDGMKEEIFEAAGLPLVRFRVPTGEGKYELKDMDIDGLVIDIKRMLRWG